VVSLMPGHARLVHCGRIALLLAAIAGCGSPEARRTRDGGPGADIGNKKLTDAPVGDPQPADTTLWPGRNPAPVERLARGEIPPPAGVSSSSAPAAQGQKTVTPDVPATKAERSTFDRGTSANPRGPARPPAPPP
jgi:hypothetical protein